MEHYIIGNLSTLDHLRIRFLHCLLISLSVLQVTYMILEILERSLIFVHDKFVALHLWICVLGLRGAVFLTRIDYYVNKELMLALFSVHDPR